MGLCKAINLILANLWWQRLLRHDSKLLSPS